MVPWCKHPIFIVTHRSLPVVALLFLTLTLSDAFDGGEGQCNEERRTIAKLLAREAYQESLATKIGEYSSELSLAGGSGHGAATPVVVPTQDDLQRLLSPQGAL